MKNMKRPSQPGLTEFVEVLPGRQVTNNELPVCFPGIENRAGVDLRNLPGPKDTYITVAREAVHQLLKQREIKGADCAGMVVATCDIVDPRSFDDDIHRLAKSFGIKGKSVAVQYACSGFPKAVSEAMAIENPDQRPIVIATGDTINFLDWSDCKTCSPFGAGGSATTLENDGRWRVLYADAEIIQDSGNSISLQRRTAVDVYGMSRSDRNVLCMNGKNLLRTVPRLMHEDLRRALYEAHLTIDDCQGIIPHRASAPLLDELRKHLEKEHIQIPVIDALRSGGNTGSSTIPMTIARRQADMKGCYALVAAGAAPHFENEKLTHGVVLIQE